MVLWFLLEKITVERFICKGALKTVGVATIGTTHTYCGGETDIDTPVLYKDIELGMYNIDILQKTNREKYKENVV